MRPITVLLALLLAGCAPMIEVLPVDPTPRPPANALPALLLEDPKEEFTPIAIVRVSNSAFAAGMDQKRTALLQKAQQLGGEAVILSLENEEQGVVIPLAGGGAVYGSSSARVLVGKVIVFKK